VRLRLIPNPLRTGSELTAIIVSMRCSAITGESRDTECLGTQSEAGLDAAQPNRWRHMQRNLWSNVRLSANLHS